MEYLPWETTFSFFPRPAMLSLAQTSSIIRRAIIKFIEENYTFRIPKATYMSMYSPQRAVIADPNSIGPTLTHIKFIPGIDLSLDTILPDTLTNLTFGVRFNNPLDHLPPLLTHLSFHVESSFNFPLDYLPSRLTHLKLGMKFSQSVDNLPSSLKHLQFGIEFDQAVDHLPPFLELLTFGVYDPDTDKEDRYEFNFNHPVDHLPPTLQELKSSDRFDHPVDFLPVSLLKLYLCNSEYSYALDNLPKSLTHLYTTFGFSADNLPPKLLHLEICYSDLILHHLPSTLTTLISPVADLDYLPDAITTIRSRISNSANIDNLPPSVTSLDVRFYEDFSNDEDDTIQIEHLPPALKFLRIESDKQDLLLDNLPESLLHLDIAGTCPISILPSLLQSLTMTLEGDIYPFHVLPNSITVLHLYGSKDRTPFYEHLFANLPPTLKNLLIIDPGFTIPITNLPPTLTHLTLASFYPQELDLRLCTSLTHLRIDGEEAWYCHPLDKLPESLLDLAAEGIHGPIDQLPHSITKMNLKFFNSRVDFLPSSLTMLSLGDLFNLPVDHLPPSLTHLVFGALFDQSVDHLPESLQVLKFCDKFNHPVDHLPSELKTLRLGACFSHSLNLLPYSLENLFLSYRYTAPRKTKLPPYVEITIMADNDNLVLHRWLYEPTTCAHTMFPIDFPPDRCLISID